MDKRTIKCTECGEVIRLKKAKRIREGIYCPKCYRTLHKAKREHLLRNVLGVRTREQVMREAEQRRIERAANRAITKPQIKPARSPQTPRNKYLGMYLTKEERQMLFKKFIQSGLSYESTKERIKQVAENMRELTRRLREQKKEDKEIDKKFKEEFNKILNET